MGLVHASEDMLAYFALPAKLPWGTTVNESVRPDLNESNDLPSLNRLLLLNPTGSAMLGATDWHSRQLLV